MLWLEQYSIIMNCHLFATWTLAVSPSLTTVSMTSNTPPSVLFD